MKLEEGTIYHIFNQGNNKQKIFLEERNYYFFLKKMNQFIKPYGDFLCYCLMPNHFHWLFFVRKEYLPMRILNSETKNPEKLQSINDSIGIVLRSYTRGINRQMNWSGSLFRNETKAKDGCIDEFITVDSKHWRSDDYLGYCFEYIHQNPVKAGLVSSPEDWEFSSARAFLGNESTVCNIELAKEIFEL